MSERTWVSRRFERVYRGYEMEVYETGSEGSTIWVWVVRQSGRNSKTLHLGNAAKARLAKLYARRAVEKMPRARR